MAPLDKFSVFCQPHGRLCFSKEGLYFGPVDVLGRQFTGSFSHRPRDFSKLERIRRKLHSVKKFAVLFVTGNSTGDRPIPCVPPSLTLLPRVFQLLGGLAISPCSVLTCTGFGLSLAGFLRPLLCPSGSLQPVA